jgi:hypothetical protein
LPADRQREIADATDAAGVERTTTSERPSRLPNPSRSMET